MLCIPTHACAAPALTACVVPAIIFVFLSTPVQELMKKLNGMVSNVPRTQLNGMGSSGNPRDALALLPGVATTPPAYAPNPGDQAVWAARVSASREDALSQADETLHNDDCFNEPLSPRKVGDKVEGSLGSDLGQFTAYQGTIHGMMKSGVCKDALRKCLN